jgi:predicted nuclease of predicted toxin-antitoxin system
MGALLFDENVPRPLVAALRSLGHDVETVFSLGLKSASDRRIYAVAQDLRRAVVTADLDFANLRDFPLTRHSGIVVLRFKGMFPHEHVERALSAFVEEIPEDLTGCLVIVDRIKTRIRRA